MEKLESLVNGNERLVQRGRHVDTRFMVEVGDVAWLITIRSGRVVSVRRGPFVMPSWTFALRASREEWERFWQPVPQPGSHDLFAMLKRRVLRIEGDLHPFMANLLYFKAVMASLRPAEAAR
jgi:hypothetical protein